MFEADVSRSRVAWWAMGAVLAAVLAFIVHSFIGTLVFAVFIYYATRPVYTRLRRRLGSPSLAAAVSLLVLALPVVLLLSYAVAIGLQEVGTAAESVDLGPYEQAVGPYLNVSDVVDHPGALLNDPNLVRTIRSASNSAFTYAGFIANGLLHGFVVFAIAFYLLRDGAKLSHWIQRQFGDDAGVLVAYGRAVDIDLYKVFAGNIFNAVITGAIGAIVYSLINYFAPATSGVPYPALIGLMAGAASLVPVVGMKLVYVPIAAYLFLSEFTSAEPVLWVPTAFTLISFVVVDTIPDLVLRPYVSGRNLHVGLVMFAYIFGPLLFGWYGIFLGPILLVVIIHFARVVLPELVAGTELQPFAVDPGSQSEFAVAPSGSTGPASEPSEPHPGPSADGRSSESSTSTDDPLEPDGQLADEDSDDDSDD